MRASLLCLLLKNEADILENHFHKEENVWCAYKVSVCVLLSVLFLMMSVIYTLRLRNCTQEREREMCGENIGVFFLWVFLCCFYEKCLCDKNLSFIYMRVC